MTANRLDAPGSKLACAERWLPDIAWLPEAEGLAVDQLYRALDVLAAHAEAIQEEVFLKTADLFKLDLDLIFYDTTTAWFATDEADGLRQRGHAKDGPEGAPQVVIALAVTRDGMPVRSWVLPGDTADVATVARIKDDLRAWRLGRCVLVGAAGLYSADNLGERGRGLGRYILAVPMRKLKEVEGEVLARPGRYRRIAANLEVKEVWVGQGERRRRYVVCFNPEEAERQRQRRAVVLGVLQAELALLAERDQDHPKAACQLIASRRFARYLSVDEGRPRLDPAKIKVAERFDGKFAVTTNDDSLTAEDVALGYQGAWIIEHCFRKLKTTGLEIRPVYHWTPRRIVAHVKLGTLALQIQRAAEIRTGLSWARLAHELAALKAVRYRTEARTMVQRTRIRSDLGELLKKLAVSIPKQLLAVSEPAAGAPDA
jgi:transposase